MYDAGPKWIKKGSRYKAPEAKQRVNYARSPSAPSIPNRHQSYGYEEDPSGKLVMQKSPERIHTGAKLDTVGPGEYELAGSPLKGKAPTWANSKADRGTKVSRAGVTTAAMEDEEGHAAAVHVLVI